MTHEGNTGGPTGSTGRVLTDLLDGVLHVRLSHPARRNALTWHMYDGLEKACETADSEDVRVIVLRGEGGRAFAAGTDIRQFTEFTGAADGIAYERRTGRVIDRLLAVRAPVIAVVQGPAVGAGLALAAAADLVLATPDAVFGAPIAHTLGNCLPASVVARLRDRLGAARTMAMLLTAQLLDAEAARTAGLVTELIPEAELEERVRELVERVRRAAPLTVAALKETDRRLQAAAAACDNEDLLRLCYGSRDFREGVNAFLEHRDPRWEGR